MCWSTSPWSGPRDWQQALDRLLRSWQNTLGASGRVPPGWDRARQQDPDHEVLSRAGFDVTGRYEFSVEHRWTIPELAGHIRSTSFLPPSVLADRASKFDTDLIAELGRHTANDRLTETVDFAYELARRPARA